MPEYRAALRRRVARHPMRSVASQMGMGRRRGSPASSQSPSGYSSTGSVFALRDFSPRTSPPVRPSLRRARDADLVARPVAPVGLALVHSSSTTRLPFG